MDRRNFFGSIGALFGAGALAATSDKKAPKKPWHAPPYVVEVWKPFSNPTIYNYVANGTRHPVEFDTLKQAENWANARKSNLQTDGVYTGTIMIKSENGQTVQDIIWGPHWSHSTVYVDGPREWDDSCS